MTNHEELVLRAKRDFQADLLTFTKKWVDNMGMLGLAKESPVIMGSRK